VSDLERIEGVAIFIRGTICSRPAPYRHHDILQWAENSCIPRELLLHVNQGFVTNKGRFVRRDEALKIAVAAGQMLGPRKSGAEILTSEDVW
jgi:hypothetical protein